ncbi:zinc-ribbon domain-containing protein [Lactobacillus amylovorus]|uniref:zinc-ribbon domain-containing protein n=1 Tax=Lactobacillus amylovorus TaxID=1604 RepID=UPI0021A83E40|nr:zinc-ribbon domain-containing protein [Lactobacillus amylovorus]MCT3601186.1 hypothetical protein [Lactobacillus amylovorus]
MLSFSDVQSRVNKYNKNIKVIPPYLGARMSIKYICTKCGYLGSCKATLLMNGQGCANCERLKREKNKDTKFKEQLKEEHPEYKILGQYQGRDVPIKIQCSKCGSAFTITPASLLYRDQECANCKRNRRFKIQEVKFRKQMKKKHPELKILGKYKGTEVKIKVLCIKCRNSWSVTPHSLVSSNSGCPNCAKRYHTSFPEQAIYFYVKQVFADAINDYRPTWLHNKEIDIYLPNTKIGTVGIEYDGIAYHSSRFNADKDKFTICKKHNVTLIRVKEKYPRKKVDQQKLNSIADFVILTDTEHKKLPSDIEKIFDLLSVPQAKRPIIDIDKDKHEIFDQYLYTTANSLAETNPKLAKEWDYAKNNPLTPDMVHANSGMRVWWICSKGHEWQRKISARVSRQSGCPECSPTHTKTEEEWNRLLRKAGDKIIKFRINGSNKSLIKCQNGHRWEARLADLYSNIKKGNNGCQECAGNRKFTVSEVYKKIMKINPWVDNLDMTNYQNIKTQTSYKCKKCHRINHTSFQHLLEGHRCPSCRNKELHPGMPREQFYKLLEKNNPKLRVWSEFTNYPTHLRVEVECTICHKVWKTEVKHLLNGNRRCGCLHKCRNRQH